MFTIQQSVTIARPVDQVFAFLADPNNIPNWRPDVLEARSDGGPLQYGERVRRSHQLRRPENPDVPRRGV